MVILIMVIFGYISNGYINNGYIGINVPDGETLRTINPASFG